jgi:hypothetical protein
LNFSNADDANYSLDRRREDSAFGGPDRVPIWCSCAEPPPTTPGGTPFCPSSRSTSPSLPSTAAGAVAAAMATTTTSSASFAGYARAARVRQFLSKKTPAAWQKQREPRTVTKLLAQRIVDAYFSREHFEDREGCCPPLGTACDAQRGGGGHGRYQEVVEQMVRVFEDHLNEPRQRDRALAIIALCVGGMVLARSVGEPALANDFRRTARRGA